MLIVKSTKIKTLYSMQELHLCLFSSSAECNSVEYILATFISSTFSVHSSTHLSTNFFLHLQFSQSKYSPISHDLSHSHLQLLRFQINPLPQDLYQSILSIHTCIYHLSNIVYYYKHSHLGYIYTYTFHAVLCVLFHQFLTFKFLTTS